MRFATMDPLAYGVTEATNVGARKTMLRVGCDVVDLDISPVLYVPAEWAGAMEGV